MPKKLPGQENCLFLKRRFQFWGTEKLNLVCKEDKKKIIKKNLGFVDSEFVAFKYVLQGGWKVD